MKIIIFLGFLIISFNCELTRQSGDVLKRERIFIEAHRGVSRGQTNHNTKEAIINSINNGVEAFETDVWLTSDKILVLNHDGNINNYDCNNNNPLKNINQLKWSELKDCETKEGKYKMPLLEEIMKITKGKIFMNLEIKDEQDEVWEKIEDLIEKYKYYDQISISSFQTKYFQKVEDYNNKYNRTIVFGFLCWNIFGVVTEHIYNINKPNHQISVNAKFILNNKKFVKEAHDKGMTVGVYFFSESRQYYDLFEIGVDVIITDYPLEVARQLNIYYSNDSYLEGCKSFEKNEYNIFSCILCENGYHLVLIREQNRKLCKLKYEIDPDLYTKDNFDVYQEKNIFGIKMLFSPFDKSAICQKNGKTIFYFEWRFDLYGYDFYERKFILKIPANEKEKYSKLTEKHIKKLDFSEIQIFIDNNLINKNDFLCIDLYDVVYFNIYNVMGAHCYFIYNGEKKNYYTVEFKLFDAKYLSFVTYESKYLDNIDSWRKSDKIYFYSSDDSSSLCSKIKDPFQERISCINKINNCMYCENENMCKKCNFGFTLFNEQCLPLINFENNLKYFTSDNGINYYTCSSMINNCEECSYDDFSFNKFLCSKCSNGFNLSETYECIDNIKIEPTEKIKIPLKIIFLGFANYKYIRGYKIVYFYTYLVYVKATVYAQTISIKTNIKYKIGLRTLQDSEDKDSLCTLVDNEFGIKKKYNCTIDTNGEEIENIEVDKNVEIKDDNIEISNIEVNPIAIKQMNDLQNIGDEDPFSKNLYILNNSTTAVDNNKKLVNITGYIEDKHFNYTKLNLQISLLTNLGEKIENISCDSIKFNDSIYTLQCRTNKTMNGQLNNGFSDLGNDNLIINFLDGEKKNLNFEEKENENITKIIPKKESSGGLSAGGIMVIVICSVAFIIFVSTLIIYFAKKKKREKC